MLFSTLLLAPLVFYSGVQALPKHKDHEKDATPIGKPEGYLSGTVTKNLMTSMDSISSSLIQFNQRLGEFEGGRTGIVANTKITMKLAKLKKASRSIAKDLEKATKMANAGPNFSPADSMLIAKKLNDTLPIFSLSMRTLIEKKGDLDTALWEKGSVSKHIAKDLQKQGAAATELAGVLVAKMAPESLTGIPAQAAVLNQQFEEVLAMYRVKNENSYDALSFKGTPKLALHAVKATAGSIKNAVKTVFSSKYRKQMKQGQAALEREKAKEQVEVAKKIAAGEAAIKKLEELEADKEAEKKLEKEVEKLEKEEDKFEKKVEKKVDEVEKKVEKAEEKVEKKIETAGKQPPALIIMPIKMEKPDVSTKKAAVKPMIVCTKPGGCNEGPKP